MGEPQTSVTEALLPDSSSTCCDDLLQLIEILDERGRDAYDQLLTKVIAESPAEHRETWTLLLELSREPFTYDNFNPAVDSLDRIFEDLNSQCTGLELLVVNDDGRITKLR